MTTDPLATVAMVTYNSQLHVAESIDSVLASSYRNFELVVCDDCSNDSTWGIVSRYKDPRIRAFRNERNLGEYANRNRALELAQGEYIIYIDGDDILYPHGLEHMVRTLHAFPEAVISVARPWSEKFIYPVVLSPAQVYLSEYLGASVLGVNFTRLLFRTEMLRALGGVDVRYKTGDTYIQLLVALTAHSLLINDGLTWWRRTPGQASQSILRDHIHALESVRYGAELLKHPACPLMPAEVDLARANLYGGFIRLLLRVALKGRILHALWLLKEAHIPLLAWRYAVVPGRRSFMSDVTAEAPLASDPRRNPFTATADQANS